MDRAIAMKWAEYLEQPGRKQVSGVLDAGGGRRCCLGHLCAMLGVRSVARYNAAGMPSLARSYNGWLSVLPHSVVKKTGMQSSSGRYGHDISATGLDISLAADNDAGIPLADIAKTIRKHWREL
jgi:hypothetical protein